MVKQSATETVAASANSVVRISMFFRTQKSTARFPMGSTHTGMPFASSSVTALKMLLL